MDSIESTWLCWVRYSKIRVNSRSLKVLVGDTVSLVCSARISVITLAFTPKSFATSRALYFARLKQATS